MICADSFGASLVLDSKTAIMLPPGSGSDEYAQALLGITNELLGVLNFDKVESGLLWDNKAARYVNKYREIVEW